MTKQQNPDEFSVRLDLNGPDATIVVTGEIDVATSHRLEETMIELVGTDVSALAIDMAGVTFMDSFGLRALTVLVAKRPDVAVTITNARPIVRKVMELTGMDKRLDLD